MICLPVGPRCDECSLSAHGLCPSARKVSSPRKPRPSASPIKAQLKRESDNADTNMIRKMEIDPEDSPAMTTLIKEEDGNLPSALPSSEPRMEIPIELEPSLHASRPFPSLLSTVKQDHVP